MVVFTKQTVWFNAAKPEPPNTMLTIFSSLTMVHREQILHDRNAMVTQNGNILYNARLTACYATKCSTFQGYTTWLGSLVIAA